MTDREFERIKEYVYRNFGINLENKKVIIAGKLDNYLRTNGINSYDEYMNLVEGDITGKQAHILANMVTTNHTYFMREFEQMEFFKEIVLPQLKAQSSNTRDLRIWCGAASSGEEPYTIAMIIKDFFAFDYKSWDTTILATDISNKVLSTAIKGCYTREQIEPLPDNWKRANFQKINENEYCISKEIKDHVLFREFNLMHQFPFKKKMQVVFLRNVMIYFDTKTKRELIQKIYDAMEPGGYLFIGNTESIDKEATQFKYIKPSVFQK